MSQLGHDVLGPHAGPLAATLVAEVGGRLWDGKECLLTALAALAKTAPGPLGVKPGHEKVRAVVNYGLERKGDWQGLSAQLVVDSGGSVAWFIAWSWCLHICDFRESGRECWDCLYCATMVVP